MPFSVKGHKTYTVTFMFNKTDLLWTERESWERSCANMRNKQLRTEKALSWELMKSEVLEVLYMFCDLDGSVEPLCVLLEVTQVPQVTPIAPVSVA